MKHNILLFFLALLFGSCQPTGIDPADAPKNPFFDLKDYFEKEMKIKRSDITKTTTFEGETETVHLPTVDLEKELKIFSDANLNKVAWYEKYAIESAQTKQGSTKISYRTEDPKLKTKSVEIFKNKMGIDSILIHNQMSSTIMNTEQYLAYYPNVGYLIRIEQKGSLQEVGDMKIEVKF